MRVWGKFSQESQAKVGTVHHQFGGARQLKRWCVGSPIMVTADGKLAFPLWSRANAPYAEILRNFDAHPFNEGLYHNFVSKNSNLLL